MWFLWEAQAFWIISGPWSRVPAEIKEDPRVALEVDFCDITTGRTEQVVVRGEAELLSWDDDRAYRLLRRYLGDDVAAWDLRFRQYMNGEPGCVWVRLGVENPKLVDMSFTTSR